MGWKEAFAETAVGKFAGYGVANLPTLVPIAAAYFVAVTIGNAFTIPQSCGDKRAEQRVHPTMDWLLCDVRPNPLADYRRLMLPKAATSPRPAPDVVLDQHWVDIDKAKMAREAKGDTAALAADTAALAADIATLDADTARLGDYAPRLAADRARLDVDSARLIADQIALANQQKHDTDKATLDADKARIDADKARLDADNAGLTAYKASFMAEIQAGAREASGRLGWVTAYAILIAMSVIAVFGAMIGIGQGVLQHRRATAQDAPPDPNAPEVDLLPDAKATTRMSLASPGAMATLYFLQFAVIAFIGAVVVFLAEQAVVGWIFGHGRQSVEPGAAMTANGQPLFNDALMVWLTYEVKPLEGYLDTGSALFFLGLIFIATFVSSCLYQSPYDGAFRRRKDLSEPRNARYQRYLGRSFGRLKLAIYLGAALLVAMMSELAAQYAWAVTLFPASAAQDDAVKALGQFGQDMATKIGLGFSLLLLTLYLPAVMLLRQRGREYRRARAPDETLEDQNKFLDKLGLSIQWSDSYGQIIAVLAPAAIGSVASGVFKLLG
jgi:hypothetical protein